MLAEILYALAVMFAIGKWAIHAAYLERGHEAVGGEYCLMALAYWAAWKAIHGLFDALEDWDHARRRKKREPGQGPRLSHTQPYCNNSDGINQAEITAGRPKKGK